MDQAAQVVAFTVEGRRFALPLSAVERVVRAVFVAPWPGGPPAVLGLIGVEGQTVPVLDLRRRFGLPARDIELSDQIVLVRTPRRRLAVVADAVSGVAAAAELPDGTVLLRDPDGLLSAEEDEALRKILGAGAAAR